MPASTGSTIVEAAASTPGTASTRRTTCVVRFATLAVVEYDVPASDVWNVNTLRASKPGFDGAQSDEAADQQRGADQQHERQRHFDDDQRRADPLVTHTGAGAAAGLLERRDEVGLGGVQRRKQTEHDPVRTARRHREHRRRASRAEE